MISIDTDFDKVTVEIEGKEYELAPNTIETAEKLEKIDKEYANKPQYKTWLAEIEIMLGKEASSEVFCSGKSEDINRIHAIHSGLVRAFNYTHDEIERESATQIDDISAKLGPINEFLKRAQALDKK